MFAISRSRWKVVEERTSLSVIELFKHAHDGNGLIQIRSLRRPLRLGYSPCLKALVLRRHHHCFSLSNISLVAGLEKVTNCKYHRKLSTSKSLARTVKLGSTLLVYPQNNRRRYTELRSVYSITGDYAHRSVGAEAFESRSFRWPISRPLHRDGFVSVPRMLCHFPAVTRTSWTCQQR